MFVRTQGNVLPPLCCGLLYNFFAFSLFFIGVATLFKNRLGLSLPRGAYAPGDLVLFVQNNISIVSSACGELTPFKFMC